MNAATPDGLLALKRAEPFDPFQITYTTGQQFAIRQPGMCHVTRQTLVLFVTDAGGDELDARCHMFGHSVIDRIDAVDDPAIPQELA